MLVSNVRPEINRAEASDVPNASLLGGVSETMLLTLWGRAEAARRRRNDFDDPRAIEAIDGLSIDFSGRYGRPSPGPMIRAKWSDSLIRQFLARNPRAFVLALGEGLETQFWRVDNGLLEWCSVDLPEAISFRRRVLPSHERNTSIEGSVTELQWLESIPVDRPTLITANGLLMYLTRPDVVRLLQALAAKFQSTEILFDTIPEWVSRRAAAGLKLTRNYRLPLMPFGVGIAGLPQLSSEAPALRVETARTYGESFPTLTPMTALLSRWSYYRDHLSPALIHATLNHGSGIDESRRLEF